MKPELPAFPKKARIERILDRNGRITFRVFLGFKADKKKAHVRFKIEREAELFVGQWNAKLEAGDGEGLSDLTEAGKAEIRAQILRLREAGAKLPEAVDFFLNYNMPSSARISVEEAVKRFIEIKHSAVTSDEYLEKFLDTYLKPFQRSFSGRFVSDITPMEAQQYIKQRGKNWSPTSKADQIRRMTVFYNTLIRAKYARLNPFSNIEKPRYQSINPHGCSAIS